MQSPAGSPTSENALTLTTWPLGAAAVTWPALTAFPPAVWMLASDAPAALGELRVPPSERVPENEEPLGPSTSSWALSAPVPAKSSQQKARIVKAPAAS